jgi:hypothetical protein
LTMSVGDESAAHRYGSSLLEQTPEVGSNL